MYLLSILFKTDFLFLAALHLHCCGHSPVVVSCGHSLLQCSGSSLRGFPSSGAQAPGCVGSVVARLSCQAACGPRTRNRTRVPCTGWRIPNHWTSRDYFHYYYLIIIYLWDSCPPNPAILNSAGLEQTNVCPNGQMFLLNWK